ncbi:MAG TPA: hypothetical protein PL155_02140 [Candidatus Omnitrophota bacterium]|nr:hypothetical protein [Candidatus Omnitrophota bacterium]HPD84713.1 hypothetical protein [Candidatus Omnitrophota bacterium]HRZ03571.1 hypothetical protein [Candidatus Omnitrophota bacterium]
MKKTLLILFCFVFFGTACEKNSPITTIDSEMETMREGGFEFEHPSDWKISGIEDATATEKKKASYHFTHPKNKICRVSIEIYNLKDLSPEQLNKMIAMKARELKENFAKAGYANFSFETSSTGMISRKPATRLTASGVKDGVTRKIVMDMMIYKNSFYAISYQWLDSWSKRIESRLAEIAATFHIL